MSTIATTIATIVRQLHTAIGVFVAREARPRHIVWLGTRAFAELRPPQRLPALPQPAWALLRHRLAHLAERFQALFDRWQSNTLPIARPPRPGRVRRPDPRPTVGLPRASGWVARRIPEAAPPASFLLSLLQNPDTRTFVQAAPQAARLLRPLCRALGIPQPDWLRLPSRPRASRPAAANPIGPPPPPDQSPPDQPTRPPDRPLPSYVRAAARAWRDPPRLRGKPT